MCGFSPTPSAWSSPSIPLCLLTFIINRPCHLIPNRSHAQSLAISHIRAVRVFLPGQLNTSIQFFWEGKKYNSISPQSPQTWKKKRITGAMPRPRKNKPLPPPMSIGMQRFQDDWMSTHGDRAWPPNTRGSSPARTCFRTTRRVKHKFVSPPMGEGHRYSWFQTDFMIHAANLEEHHSRSYRGEGEWRSLQAANNPSLNIWAKHVSRNMHKTASPCLTRWVSVSEETQTVIEESLGYSSSAYLDHEGLSPYTQAQAGTCACIYAHACVLSGKFLFSFLPLASRTESGTQQMTTFSYQMNSK